MLDKILVSKGLENNLVSKGLDNDLVSKGLENILVSKGLAMPYLRHYYDFNSVNSVLPRKVFLMVYLQGYS